MGRQWGECSCSRAMPNEGTAFYGACRFGDGRVRNAEEHDVRAASVSPAPQRPRYTQFGAPHCVGKGPTHAASADYGHARVR